MALDGAAEALAKRRAGVEEEVLDEEGTVGEIAGPQEGEVGDRAVDRQPAELRPGPAEARVLDAAALREAEVGPLADDAHAQLGGVEAQGVVGAVARRGVVFPTGLDIRADAAEPEEVGPRAEDRLHQGGRRNRARRQLERA